MPDVHRVSVEPRAGLRAVAVVLVGSHPTVPETGRWGAELMGCDIHVFVEARGVDRWYNVTPAVPLWEDELERNSPRLLDRAFAPRRNYGIFALLADVRNGSGFAGFPTGRPVEPWKEPAGLPDDLSPEVAAAMEDWGSDFHSHTWYTAEELEEHIKAAPTRPGQKFYAWRTRDDWFKHRAGQEAPILGSVALGVPLITEEQAEALVSTGAEIPYEAMVACLDRQEGTQEPWAAAVEESIMPVVRALARCYGLGPEKVRVVMAFDN